MLGQPEPQRQHKKSRGGARAPPLPGFASCLFISLVCLFPLRATSHSHTAAQIHTHTQIPDPHCHMVHGDLGSGTWHMGTWHMGTWGHGQIKNPATRITTELAWAAEGDGTSPSEGDAAEGDPRSPLRLACPAPPYYCANRLCLPNGAYCANRLAKSPA
jgi:hypothetical protein